MSLLPVAENICPFCEEDIREEMDAAFIAHEYKIYFDHECSKCGNKIEVEVESLPLFFAHKPYKEGEGKK